MLPDSAVGKNARCACGTSIPVAQTQFGEMRIEELQNDGITAQKCTSCGGSLEIPVNVERWNCPFCGTGFAITRQNGTIGLIADAIRKVQSGTDKTAAELALKRLAGEYGGLSRMIDKAIQTAHIIGCAFAMVGFVAAFVIFEEWSTAIVSGVVLYIAAALLALKNSRLGEIRKKMDEVKQPIAENRKIVDE